MQISSSVAGDVSLVLSSATHTSRSRIFRHHSPAYLKRCPSPFSFKLGVGSDSTRARSLTVKASGDPSPDSSRLAPLELESPVGQLLAQILHTHPHLLPAAVDQQLENLSNDRESQREEAISSQDLSLYKKNRVGAGKG